MHVAVLGAGVVGVTTAWYLAEAGHEVTVIDSENAVAQGCSFANGAQLSYSYMDAMASPAFLAKMPRLLTGLDRAIRVRPPINADLLRWGLAFIGECTASKSAANTLANLRLARRSQQLMDELVPTLEGEFAHRNAGKIILLGSDKELRAAARTSELKAEFGFQADVISLAAAIDIEPAIQHMTGRYAGAVYSPGDDVGDSQAFTAALAKKLAARSSCHFKLNTTIKEIITEKRQVRAVDTHQGAIDVDAAVVCLGSWSPRLLKPLGINTGIYPVRGYSVTLRPGQHSNSVSVTDFAKRFVISRLGAQVRIAGFADFVGFRTSKDTQRVAKLLRIAGAIAPAAADYKTLPNHAWGGFRPLTANGRPLLGPTSVAGLYLNTGHGTLGWTLACASGEEVARAVSERHAADQLAA